MSDKSKSIKVGVLSIISIFLIYFGMNFLKGINILNDGITLYAYYDDVSGLTEGNSITVKGYKVGSISSIKFDVERNNQLMVNLNIEDNIDIPINTIAKIVSVDLMVLAFSVQTFAECAFIHIRVSDLWIAVFEFHRQAHVR